MTFRQQSNQDGIQTWYISCTFEIDGAKYQMARCLKILILKTLKLSFTKHPTATYEWKGDDHVLNAPCFYRMVLKQATGFQAKCGFEVFLF